MSLLIFSCRTCRLSDTSATAALSSDESCGILETRLHVTQHHYLNKSLREISSSCTSFYFSSGKCFFSRIGEVLESVES